LALSYIEVVNEQGQLLNVLLTPGNTDDRKVVPQLLQRLFGKVLGDRGYVSQKLALQLWHDGGIRPIAKHNLANYSYCWIQARSLPINSSDPWH
jgi:transposase